MVKTGLPLRKTWLAACAVLGLAATAAAQEVDVDVSVKAQTMDGFGTALIYEVGSEAWFRTLLFDDLQASMLRFDVSPKFKSPYSNYAYNSPWFHSSPSLPGPENNNVRTYTNASDYKRSYAGRNAQIAVMGPDIDRNVEYFDYDATDPRIAGALAQLGTSKSAALGGFRLVAGMWSPAPWVKLSTGNKISGQSGIMPVNGTPWPFIWGGNYAGGKLDVSGQVRADFDDSSLGGSGPTSALTQFARGLAAYLRGFQNRYGVKLYAVSLQNEPNLEVFYNSCLYADSASYIQALKAARAELDKYADLRDIKLMGPEDIIGSESTYLWYWDTDGGRRQKILQFMRDIEADPEASRALSFYCMHGYAADGVRSAGSVPKVWQWVSNGWGAPPNPSVPPNVQGYLDFGKKAWMTETSGEEYAWLAPSTGFPSAGAYSIALKINQALTEGFISGWFYWQLADGGDNSKEALTDANQRERSPKYVAAKHFYRFVKPGSYRVPLTVSSSTTIAGSAYVHDQKGTLAIVLINTSSSAATVTLRPPAYPTGIARFEAFTSSNGELWKASSFDAAASLAVPLPGYGVVSLFGDGTDNGTPPTQTLIGPIDNSSGGGSSGGTTGGASNGTGGEGSLGTGGATGQEPGTGTGSEQPGDSGTVSDGDELSDDFWANETNGGGCACAVPTSRGAVGSSVFLALCSLFLFRGMRRRDALAFPTTPVGLPRAVDLPGTRHPPR
jgi:O-glycosyl hydrolase